MITLAQAIAAELAGESRAQGFSFERLAAASGVPVRTLKRHLPGHTPITVDIAERVANALGVPMEELLVRARMRQSRAPRPAGAVIDDGVDPEADTPPVSPSRAARPAPPARARSAAAGPSDS